MGNPEQLNRRMSALEERVEKHDNMLRGDEDNEGLMSNVRQLVEADKQRKYTQRTILIGVVALLIEQTIIGIGYLISRL